MATVPVGVAGGAVTGQANKGMPVLGGQSGRNQFSPTSAIPTMPTGGMTANKGIRPINTSPVVSPGITGQVPTAQPIATQPTAATATTATAGNNGNTLAGYTPQQTQQLQKQLTDIYGKGEGGLMYSLLSNLGSNDSSYMDAYHQAMSKSTAEGMATLDTGLGNAGISANSSAAAIEKADYMSGVTSQEGLQEQQLIQTQQQEAIGLTQGMQEDAKNENSTSWLNTLAQVASVGATFAGVPGASQGMSNLFAPSNSSIPNINSGTSAAQLPGAISGGYAGSMPLSIG